MAPRLATFTCLQLLDLNSNSIGDEGAKALAHHLASLTSLQHLYLQSNNIGFFAKLFFTFTPEVNLQL